jgi:hypothetical protein
VGPLEKAIAVHQEARQTKTVDLVRQAARMLDQISPAEKAKAERAGMRHYVTWESGRAEVRCRPGGASGKGSGHFVTTNGVETRSLTSWKARLKVEKAKARARAPLMQARRKLAAAKALYKTV